MITEKEYREAFNIVKEYKAQEKRNIGRPRKIINLNYDLINNLFLEKREITFTDLSNKIGLCFDVSGMYSSRIITSLKKEGIITQYKKRSPYKLSEKFKLKLLTTDITISFTQ